MTEPIHNYVRSDSALFKKHKPRVIPKPTGPRQLSREPWSGELIAKYENDPPFRFWWVCGTTGEPVKRAPLSAAFRCVGFSGEREWAKFKHREETT